MKNIIVSVKTITYNHEPYIRQCLEGILNQITNFKFELILGDDCSTDGTREICQEYADKYPDIINFITSDSNVGAIINSKRTLDACRGKYIAFCEGDDYWTDPYKLQKQVDYLEANSDYGLVHSAYSSFIQKKEILKEPRFREIPTGDIFCTLLKGLNSISTLTVLVRSDILIKAKGLISGDINESWCMGDLPLWIGVAKYSKIGYINENTSVYRILGESASHSKSNEKIINFYKSGFEIRRWFCNKFDIKSLLDEINENELFFIYYKTLVDNMPENKDYREAVSHHKINHMSMWKFVMKLTSKNKYFSILFRNVFSLIYK